MWNSLKRFFGSSAPANPRPKSRKLIKPNGRWESAEVKEVEPDGTVIFHRNAGHRRDIPLKPDTSKRLNLKPFRKGERREIRVGNTHLGPEVARIRPLEKGR